ncbi:maintenance of mitochondrial structure and function-domain-containing protein [Mycena galopus ATCC 62051]|nr:maintenance of mitochondrial structure and function-domain-containing protein [Mycena galopus ATCC 62051]
MDEPSVLSSSNTTSGLSLSLHPLPILNISEHLTRLKFQTTPILGALLGTQNGREVEIVNTLSLPSKPEVFPSLEFIGWYTVAPLPTPRHIALHEQFTGYCSTPLLLILQPSITLVASSDVNAQTLPFKAYEPTIELRDRKSRSVFIEAERIAVDWTARGGGSGTSLESHLQTQRAAVKMLHDRIMVLVKYVSEVVAGQAPKDHATLRSLSALIASLPATENNAFRDEFETEYEDVQLTAFLSSLTKSANILNDLVDKHLVMTSGGNERGPGGPRRRGMGMGMNRDRDWDRH